MTTVAFWGAGATASLGFRTTKQQGVFVRHLAPVESSPKPLCERVRNALGCAVPDRWDAALCDLLAILGDGRSTEDATTVDDRALAAMARSSHSTDDLPQRVLRLRTFYDWPALIAIIRACPGSREPESRFRINDLLNLLDLYGGSEHGFHADGTFLTPQVIGSAKNALKMLLQTMFFIDWQACREDKKDQLALFYEFAVALTRRMQRQGVALAGERFESSKFYVGDLSFVSMNYDPLGLWCQMIANRDMNKAPTVPHIGTPAQKLEIYVDQAHFVAGPRVREGSEVWHSMNEPAIQRLNEVGERIRIIKFLLPHGCICWRECPNCGKLSNYLGDRWELTSQTPIPPPPLRAFDLKLKNAWNKREREVWEEGQVDARACVHCGTLTYAHHTSTLWQSNFKVRPPSFIEEIQRDLRVVLTTARHIVLLGYSLPTDDVGYRALLAAHRQEREESTESTSEVVRCTVVDQKEGYERWVGPAELRKNGGLQEGTPVGAAQDIFGRENVRFYGGGIPEVFCEQGTVTDHAVERLLHWKDT